MVPAVNFQKREDARDEIKSSALDTISSFTQATVVFSGIEIQMRDNGDEKIDYRGRYVVVYVTGRVLLAYNVQ